jgi:hypothetical protein
MCARYAAREIPEQEFPLIRRLSIAAASCALTAGVAAGALPAFAAGAPQLKLATKTLAITKPSNLIANHLSPKKLYFVLLAQPDLKHKKATGLVGGGMTDANGRLSISIKAPATAKCGTATLYTYQAAKSPKLYALKVTVSGCKAAKQSVPPPPPPAKP